MTNEEREKFLENCLTSEVVHDPWPHQVLNNTLSTDTFTKLQDQCIEKLNFKKINYNF